MIELKAELWKQLGEKPGTQDETAAGEGTHQTWSSSIRSHLSLTWTLPYRRQCANHVPSVLQTLSSSSRDLIDSPEHMTKL